MRQLGKNQYLLLREALRRYTRFHRDEPLLSAWTGLGSATEYAPVVDSSYMELATQPNPRYQTWWRLTERGANIVLAWLITGEDYHTVEAGD